MSTVTSKNPFRNPALISPNPTGINIPSASPSSSVSPFTSTSPPALPRIHVSSSPPLPSLPAPEASANPVLDAQRFQPPSGPPPSHNDAQSPSPSSTVGVEAGASGVAGGGGEGLEFAEDAEAPPAYTPSADVYIGESTLEVGPRRPFQRVNVQPPPQQHYTPQGYGPPPPPPQGQRHSDQHPPQAHYLAPSGPPPSSSNGNRPLAPPRHPTRTNNTNGPSSTLSPTRPPVSEFARDFYAAGAGDASQNTNRYAPPPGPPPGPPPLPGRPKSSQGHSPGMRSASSSPVDGIPDDGSPTKYPKPGHPLLLNGKLLVYPNGYECHKCNNTGFKNFDPSHPCRKCWDKYARPYTGALAYTPWSTTTSPSSSGSNFQKPLPSFRPPHLRPPAQQQEMNVGVTRTPSAPANRQDTQRHHPRSRSSPNLSRAQSNPSHPPPSRPLLQPPPSVPSSFVPPSTSLSPTAGQRPLVQFASNSIPPPGSTVVSPGDPRIGGRLCYKCSGSGVVPFMLFDEMPCGVCNGVGRTF